MSAPHLEGLDPIESPQALRDIFDRACKGDAPLGLGAEHEKFGYDAETLQPLPYEGERGVRAMLEGLADRFGWIPYFEDGKPIALHRHGGAITLEPGGQLELSGRVNRTIHETREELHQHLSEVAVIAEELGQKWAHLALNPWFSLDDVPWMPKGRYKIMRRYLPTRGALAHWMMKMTCTVQSNIDYRSEADAMELLRITTKASPIVTALFAHSSFRRSRDTLNASFRMRIWERTDADRSGVPDFFLDEAATFDDYVEYMLDVPMFLIERNGEYIDYAGRSFRRFLDGAYEHSAVWDDWVTHLSTAFPDVRMKGYLEFRTADAGPPPVLLANSALWKGIVYDSDARARVADLVDVESGAEMRALNRVAAVHGLDGCWKGTTLRRLAAELLSAARDGLEQQKCPLQGSEARYLDALVDVDGTPRSPGEDLRALWERHRGDRRAIIEHYDTARWLDRY